MKGGSVNRQLSLVLAWGVFFFITACSTSSKTPAPATDSLKADVKPSSLRLQSLSHEAAVTRFKQISGVSYTLWFGLNSQDHEFQGRTVIRFELKPKAREQGNKVILDFEGDHLQSMSLNGVSISDISRPERFDGHHIYFKMNEFTSGTNRVEIAYTHPYSTDGNGLHRFKDPADGKVYLYTNFEPYSAHRVFPCFDQPDIKASYELTVEAPKDWEVISNTLPQAPSAVDGRKSWAFPPSAIFSTYIFALHAGPYAMWKSESDGIPIRLFSRQSLAPFIDHDEWLKITQQGMEFYSVQFGFPYPFAKYDQIIVPEFNAGAMENVGAVTFSEKFVYRNKVTQNRHRQRAEVILHEMAHMWFGDLVTLKWWNGLWLNESFATFMSALAVDKATQYRNSWQAFFAGLKEWAYLEDQLVTTHPVELPVPNTEHAQANFDAITYGKGASSLKQLSFYLGEDDFREGIQRYFQKYAYRNTTITDFFKMLTEASSQDLTLWQQNWLKTSGVDTIQLQWECKAPPDASGPNPLKISKLELLQSAAPSSNSTSTRSHKTQIAFFHSTKNGVLVPKNILKINYTGPVTSISEGIGLPCPDFIFPNYGDFDYVKVILDPLSLNKISKQISRIEDPLTRQMIWHTLWSMVMDSTLKAQDYTDIVLNQGTKEKDTLVLAHILRTLVNPSANHESVLKFLTGDLRVTYQKKIEAMIKENLLHSPPGTDQQLVWYQAFLDVASEESSINFAKTLLSMPKKLPGLVIDQDHRWELIQVLARNGSPGVRDLIATELKKDSTDIGLKASISASTLLPEADSKSKWLSQINRNLEVPSTFEKLSPAKLREAMGSYQILGQEEFTQPSIDSYFETLPKIALSPAIEDEQYAKWFATSMFPSHCDPSIVQKASALLAAYPTLPASVVKILKINRQKEERCIRARLKSLDG